MSAFGEKLAAIRKPKGADSTSPLGIGGVDKFHAVGERGQVPVWQGLSVGRQQPWKAQKSETDNATIVSVKPLSRQDK